MDMFDSDSINTRVRGEGLEDILRFKKNGSLVLRYGQPDKKVETEEFVDKGIKISVKLPLRFKKYIKSKYAIKDKEIEPYFKASNIDESIVTEES